MPNLFAVPRKAELSRDDVLLFVYNQSVHRIGYDEAPRLQFRADNGNCGGGTGQRRQCPIHRAPGLFFAGGKYSTDNNRTALSGQLYVEFRYRPSKPTQSYPREIALCARPDLLLTAADIWLRVDN